MQVMEPQWACLGRGDFWVVAHDAASFQRVPVCGVELITDADRSQFQYAITTRCQPMPMQCSR